MKGKLLSIQVLAGREEQDVGSLGSATLESHQMNGPLSAWQKFIGAQGLLARYDVDPRELKVLANIQSLGKITAPRDFLFILNSIRPAIETEAAA